MTNSTPSNNATMPPVGVTAADPAHWQRVLVYGLGGSGVAASRLILDRGNSVLAVDDGEHPQVPADLREHERFELVPGGGADIRLDPIDGVVVSPGVPSDRPILRRAQAASRRIVAEVELAYRVLARSASDPAAHVCAITGSNGKSTVTQLVADLLGPGAVACGNFGVPLSDCVREDVEGALVVEMSSFQLEGIETFRPKAAALLNISDDHLDRHGDLDTYVQSKRRIFENQIAGDVAVLNADDAAVRATRLPAGVRRREFSLRAPVDDGCYLQESTVFLVEPGADPVALFERSALAVVGEHNLANAMAAVLLALPLGLDASVLEQRLGAFTGLPHRTQLVAEHNGVRWYDDSKATNVGAALQCLAGFEDGSVHLIAGGRSKGGRFVEMEAMVGSKVAHLYLVGEAAATLGEDLGGTVPLTNAGTIDRAVRLAHDAAQAGQVVLLSPACASFDQFSSYVERGLFFQDAVRAVTAGGERRG